jgi:hypothetical protein
MTPEKVNDIIVKCREFTRANRKVFIHINFLFNFQNSHRPQWFPETGTDTSVVSKDRIKCTAPEACWPLISSAHRTTINNRISNCSVLIWDGEPISYYRKSTYCNEADSLIIAHNGTNFIVGSHKYEFGDFKDHIVPNLGKNHLGIAKMLFDKSICKKPLISTKICYDLNVMPNIGNNVSLLIINANEAPNIAGWKEKIKNSVFCIQSDPYHQNPVIAPYQERGEIKYPSWRYSFFKKTGRFLPNEYRHTLEDMLPFYGYRKECGFESSSRRSL